MKAALSVDLNSDMGEGFGAYRMGDDEAILDVVTSANVACGFHGGDPEVMAATFFSAKTKGVCVGAHPGYADVWGFGRRIIPHSLGEIERLIAYQVGAAQAVSTYAGHPITYVKAHGALGNLAASDADIARAVTNAMKAVDPKLICLAIAFGHQERIAREIGMVVKSEIFADRAYAEDGQLVPRRLPGAIIQNPEVAAARVVRMVAGGGVETSSGTLLPTAIDSICLHSDSPAAVSIAKAVRSELERAGVLVANFSS